MSYKTYRGIIKKGDCPRFNFTVLTIVLAASALTGCVTECHVSTAEDIRPVSLRCEYLTNPMGIDVTEPRLSWKLESKTRGQKQTAYHILAASSRDKLNKNNGDLWDTGTVKSDQSIHVAYSGKPLASGMRCYWKVRVWDKDGKASDWSEPAEWSMGLLGPEDWNAKWIRSPKTLGEDTCPWLRKKFKLDGEPESALFQVESRGYHELWVNGSKVGEYVLSPAVSVYQKRTLYVTYNIKPLLKKGTNVIGLWLGRGWNSKEMPSVSDERPLARVQGNIRIEKSDLEIISDKSWKCGKSSYTTLGSWTWNNYGGERYDARLQNPDWCTSLCDDAEWNAAEEIIAPSAVSQSQLAPMNRIGKRIAAVSCSDCGDGNFVLDFGTDVSGWLELSTPSLTAGKVIKFDYRDSFGFDRNQRSDYNQRDEFISSGQANERFVSKFNYRGFRYVFIEGLPSKPRLTDAEALLIESDLESAGSFKCSNGLFNKIHYLNMWTIRCLNLGGYMVDCPHRERLGYGDGQVSVETGIMNLWMPYFYAKWLQDWVDVQNPETGRIPFSTPYHIPAKDGEFGREGPPGWGGALPAIAWRTYLYYGDRRLLEKMYEPMRLYLKRMESYTVDDILRGYGDKWQGLGDWVAPERGMDTKNWPSVQANEFFNNCYRIYLWQLLEQTATVLGDTEQARQCKEKIISLRSLIHNEFYDEEKCVYVIDEQAYQVMPLMTEVVPDTLRPAIMKKLEDGILVKRKGHLDTGMLGTYFLIQYLSEIGRDDLLFTIVNQKTYPGWGYMLEKGATTMWEQWNGYWSRIHSCFTSPAGWFHNGLAGIRPDATAPGFKKIIIKPAIVGDLTWVKCHHDSPYGRIVSNWKREGDPSTGLRAGKLTMEVTIPANTTATVYVPAKDAAGVTESGKPAAKAKGVKFLRMENNAAVYGVGSGTYRFESVLPETIK